VAFVIARVRVVKFLMPGSILGWKVKAPNDDPGCALEKIYSQGRSFSSLGYTLVTLASNLTLVIAVCMLCVVHVP